MSKTQSLDILGIKPIGNALDTTVKKTFEGVEGFLKSVCVPALEELGLMARDQVRYWRLKNIITIIEKAKGKLDFKDEKLQIHANPRVALAIMEHGSMTDNDEIQEMWAGLFASSCTESGQDDQNLIFVNLLNQLTSVQAKILKYSAERAQKVLYKNGLILPESVEVTFTELCKIAGTNDVQRLDRELDHLRSLELLRSGLLQGVGFIAGSDNLDANITPSALALNLYVRCHGCTDTVNSYWAKELLPYEQFEVQKKKEALEEAQHAAGAE